MQFRHQTSLQNGDGLCLCADAIYPLYFTVHYPGTAPTRVVGVAQTYLPAFGVSTPHPVQVGWVWPLIDRPHRVTSDTVFLDDDLATLGQHRPARPRARRHRERSGRRPSSRSSSIPNCSTSWR